MNKLLPGMILCWSWSTGSDAYFIGNFTSVDANFATDGVELNELFQVDTPFANGWFMRKFIGGNEKSVYEGGLDTWRGKRVTDVDFNGYSGFANSVILLKSGYFVFNTGGWIELRFFYALSRWSFRYFEFQ